MTEQDALDLRNEVQRERGRPLILPSWFKRENDVAVEALCRAIEQRNAERDLRHKAEQALADLKAEVSEAVKGCFGTRHAAHPLQRFIIPTPDPLVEAQTEDPIDALVDLLAPVLRHGQGMAARERENRFRNAIAALKLERIDQ